MRKPLIFLSAFSVLLTLVLPVFASQKDSKVKFIPKAKGLGIQINGNLFAVYSFGDEKILRPYFAHVHAPNGMQVTRTYPPIPGKDATDHADMHPGIWLAFGDLSGFDFWRNKATVKHVKFIEEPKGEMGKGTFTALNHYEAEGKILCAEKRKVTIHIRPAGYLLLLDCTFTGEKDFYFGDQEEMGLGVRVATPLTVTNGGQILNSKGLKNEKQAWGKVADWCEYSGLINGKRMGVVLMPHPDNFRKCWFHTRDYGLVAANPFGKNAFTKGPKNKIVVRAEEQFRLRFGVLIFSNDSPKGPNISEAFKDYLSLAKE